jgi:FMN phosphatase YigB (HAD superfamily)
LLIIFDLDDTLIDTSGTVTPFKMKACLQRLIREGLEVADFEAAYQELLSYNSKAARSKDALALFLEKKGANPDWIRFAVEELTSPLPAEFVISTTPSAQEILHSCKKSHTLAIVTGGHPPFQREKLEKAGIDSSIFSKIAIPEDSIKKPFYERLIEEFSFSPDQVLVCGDRIAMDLLPGYQLGFTTVHMRWGRGALVETEKWIHHAIADLRELKRIVKI